MVSKKDATAFIGLWSNMTAEEEKRLYEAIKQARRTLQR
jgi:hypothetical protein